MLAESLGKCSLTTEDFFFKIGFYWVFSIQI